MPTQPPYWKVLTRRKTLKNEANEETKLNRVLGVFDLTALGVGSTLGAGVYVLAGQIAKDQAGPSVMISFAIAALASALAGICYAEFGARVPKAGSAYVYSYVCIGEFVAFVIGWNLILEYVIGTAGVCRGISLYLDTLINDTLKTSFAEVAPIEWSFLGGYFDFFAFALAVVFGVLTAFGVETSTMFNNVCTLINIAVLLFVVIAGSIKADITNWQVESPGNFNGTEYNIGKGGYFPFGVEGTLKGAATCFFGFVGFDCIATTGEEVQNPRKNIPRSILYSLLIIFLCYFGVSTVLTLMVPYYAQDPNAPLPYAFKEVGWITAMWIVTIGGLIGLFASLFGALFPIPRIIYSMAEDGLLFSFLGKLSPRFKTPVTGSIFAAIFTGVIAGIFDLAQLVNLLSIGTLLAYIVVAISIVILRFMDNGDPTNERLDSPPDENSTLTFNGTKTTFKSIIRQVFNVQRLPTPNSLSTKIVGIITLLFCFISVACGLLIMNASEAIVNHEPWALVLLGFFVILTLISLAAVCLQPQEKCTTIFRVPLVPLVPAISIFINIYLMLQLDVMTWIRFGLWMVIGIPIFFICYCTLDKSNQQIRNRKLSFFKTLQESEINGRPEVIENGVCNGLVNSIASRSTQVVDLQSEQIESFDEITSDFSNHVEKANINADIKWFGYASLKEELATSMEENKPDDNKKLAIEEENSVIALLDDVLKYEEDFLDTPIDESVPNFQKLTTVAVIHNSLEQISEEAEKQNNTQTNDILYSEARELAITLVDDILKSHEIFEAIEARKNCKNEIQKSIESWNIDSERKRNISESSQLTQTSVDEDPLHSNSFKNKLSLLIVQQPSAANIEKKDKKIKGSISPTAKPGKEINLSKNEADVRRMVLRAIEGKSTTQNTNISSKESVDIPAPPRFDPELYKSLGTISKPNVRTRPSIDKLIAPTPKVVPAPKDVPFKKKLEAVLKRGPSNIMLRQGEIAAQVPKVPNGSLTDKRPSQSLHVPKSRDVYESPSSMRKVKAASSNLEIIDVRNNLRHVNIDRK